MTVTESRLRPTVQDWQSHGVTVKVELSTAGELVPARTRTDLPFTTGGVGGAPVGWTAQEYNGSTANNAKYNFTTASGVFSVSAAVMPTDYTQAGIQSQNLGSLKFNTAYQIACRMRLMEGKAPSKIVINLQWNNGGTWTGVASSISMDAPTDWTPVLLYISPIAGTGTFQYRLNLFGGNDDYVGQVQAPFGLWGVQWTELAVLEIANAPAPMVWRDITCDVRALTIRHGREKFTERYDVGTMRVDVLNDDGEYAYREPHPFNFRPGRVVRVTAKWNAITFNMAYMTIQSIQNLYTLDGHALSSWNCMDVSTVLSNIPVAQGYSGTAVSGIRVQWIIDQCGYPLRRLENNWIMQGIFAGPQSLRDEIGITADSEGSFFYADRDGYITYRIRTWPDRDIAQHQIMAELLARPSEYDLMPADGEFVTNVAAPLICCNSLDNDWSDARIINIVSLANRGSTAQIFTDPPSITAYGPFTYQRHDFVIWQDSYLATRANDYLSRYKDAQFRVNRVTYNPAANPDSWEFTLGVWLNWLVRVWYAHPENLWGYAIITHVQSVEHNITPDRWSTLLTIDDVESFKDAPMMPLYLWDTPGQFWDDSKTTWG